MHWNSESDVRTFSRAYRLISVKQPLAILASLVLLLEVSSPPLLVPNSSTLDHLKRKNIQIMSTLEAYFGFRRLRCFLINVYIKVIIIPHFGVNCVLLRCFSPG
jgi:hypothetical protein